MKKSKIEVIIIKRGRFKGKKFKVEGTINDDLVLMAVKGNFAARNAVLFDKYTFKDVPFFYGKIGTMGYIISKHDLGVRPQTKFVMPTYK